MIRTWITKGRGALASVIFGLLSVATISIVNAVPAHAANLEVNWTGAQSMRLGGSILAAPVDITGDFTGDVYGTPAGSQTYLSTTNGAVNTSLGCSVSIAINIYPGADGKLDYTKGKAFFTTSAPSTCTQDQIKANVPGVYDDPNAGNANVALNITIGGVDKRGAAAGDDTKAKQLVNVTAGMGPASNNEGIPDKDSFLLCAADGAYANNVDALTADCLAKKSGALTNAINSGALKTIQDGKGPEGGDEKGWTGQFKNVKAGIYTVCSVNFKACQLFTKNPGEVANVYINFGSTPGSVVPGTVPGQGGPDDQKVCTTGEGLVGALAWILCPAVQLMADASNFFEKNIIVPFMTISPLTTNANNPIYILWRNIRDFANIIFVLFFFAVVFSTATSIGISNYGVKRVLPKMIAVVIGVNLSYFFVAFVIDGFNIFGGGISQLVTTALQSTPIQGGGGDDAGATRSIFTLGTAALVGIVATAGAAIGWFIEFLGLALLVIIVVVIVLVLRQIAIIVLTIVAPLAILAAMLPNTEQYYNRWRKMLIQLLMMYPLMVLLFAAGKIFGIILQQPGFDLGGDNGVSKEVAGAVRVFLQFIVYVIPLVGMPALFAASGSLMNRAYGALNGRLVSGKAQRFKENTGLMNQEAKARMARGVPIGGDRRVKIPGISQLAGRGAKRDFVRGQRQRNLEREQQEYLSSAVENSAWLQRRAAGVGGEGGRTRAAAAAANAASKGRTEDLDAEMSLLEDEMRNLGVDQKTFAAWTREYMEDPTNASKQIRTGSTGKQFNFVEQQGKLQRALLNSAAQQGEIGAIEAARLNSTMDQTMVDDIIRRNDGKLKEKGGYHLATDFKLAHGRDGNNTTTDDGMDAALVKMNAARLGTIASSGANSVAGMKAGVLGGAADLLSLATVLGPATSRADQRKRQVAIDTLNELTTEQRQNIYNRVRDIAANPTTLARTEAPDAIIKMRDTLLSYPGITP